MAAAGNPTAKWSDDSRSCGVFAEGVRLKIQHAVHDGVFGIHAGDTFETTRGLVVADLEVAGLAGIADLIFGLVLGQTIGVATPGASLMMIDIPTGCLVKPLGGGLRL